MAVMKLTAFNGGMKGKIAGTIFQGSIAGQVVKTGIIDGLALGAKLTKADAQEVIPNRKNWTKAATSWRDLTDAQRLTWTTGAVNYPFTNKFGDPYTPSGFQVYQSINSTLLNAGLTMLDNIPAPGGILNAPPISVTTNSTHNQLILGTFTQTTGYTYTLYATTNISPGSKPKASAFKALYILANPETLPLDFTSAYEDVFGSMPQSANLWFKMEIINDLNAQKGQKSLFNFQY